MLSKYHIQWLINKFDWGEPLEFLFFWGHSTNLNEPPGQTCLSQWFELPFLVDGKTYKTAEHWMMANKALLFNDLETYTQIINSKTPAEAKGLGRKVSGFDDQVWNNNRMNIVIKGNIHKFNQHPQFASCLINTNNKILVEASPVDRIWGIGLANDAEHIDNPYFWNGQNLLGFALMEVRDFLVSFGHFEEQNYQIDTPWKIYPKIDPADMFWRMGQGEDIIYKFSKYYNALSERDKTILRLTNPEPYHWKGFFGTGIYG